MLEENPNKSDCEWMNVIRKESKSLRDTKEKLLKEDAKNINENKN